MPSISNGSTTHNVITFQGQVQPLGLTLQEITRQGVNGHAFRELANHSDPFTLIAFLDVNNNAAVATTLAAMVAAYQGKVVTVVDDLGTSYANLVCLKIAKVESYKIMTAVGGVSVSKGAMLAVGITLQST